MTKTQRVDHQIAATLVRVIDEDGAQLGILSLEDALHRAKSRGLNLVEVGHDASPPVCRIMNYGKRHYERQRQQQAQRKKQRQMQQLKEVKLRPVTGEADYQTKLKHITGFLEKRMHVKITMRFRGREMSHVEIGEALLVRLLEEIDHLALVERAPKLEGRQITMMLKPKTNQV